MASDSGADDVAALRDRVTQLEQTVAEQQQTIEALQQPPVSRRGVLAALTGVAGAGALGAYSQRGAAQAAGQVGTSSEPVDVEAWSLNVQGQLAGDLDAGGNDLTNVAAVEAVDLVADNVVISQDTAGQIQRHTAKNISLTFDDNQDVFAVSDPVDIVEGTIIGGGNGPRYITVEWGDGSTSEIKTGQAAADDDNADRMGMVNIPPIKDVVRLTFNANSATNYGWEVTTI